MNHLVLKVLLLVSLAGLLVNPATADEKAAGAETRFQRGFYLEVHQHDLTAAAAAYEQVIADDSTPAALAAAAKARLARVREDLACVDLAHLMPADVMGYAELSEPGKHVGRILKMMGLVAGPGEREAAKEPPIPLGEGFYLPADFSVSPALAAELEKIRGAAAGVTSIDQRGRPSGLLVIHPGDCDLLRGVIETGVQLLEPGETIEGYKTYRLRDLGWVMLTTRLVLASDSRAQLVGAVERLRNPQAESLASQAAFKRVRQQPGGALLFAYVDGPQAVKLISPKLRGQEAALIRGLADLEHLESLVVNVTTREDAIAARVQLNLMNDHHNLAYALIRTAPMSRRSLAQVPANSAAVLVLGLNPAGPAAATGQTAAGVSAMDVGRELFHNIDELAVFALPATDSATSHGAARDWRGGGREGPGEIGSGVEPGIGAGQLVRGADFEPAHGTDDRGTRRSRVSLCRHADDRGGALGRIGARRWHTRRRGGLAQSGRRQAFDRRRRGVCSGGRPHDADHEQSAAGERRRDDGNRRGHVEGAAGERVPVDRRTAAIDESLGHHGRSAESADYRRRSAGPAAVSRYSAADPRRTVTARRGSSVIGRDARAANSGFVITCR